MAMQITKKTLTIGAVIVAAAILAIIFGLKIASEQPKKIGYEYFTKEPGPWIEKDTLSSNNGDVIINVKRATRDKSVLEGNQQDYLDNDNSIVSFFTNGYYKGFPFNRLMIADAFYNESQNADAAKTMQLANKYTLMKISPDMNPNDGIINGFILGKAEDGKFVFYIFVDEDWKNKIQDTKILWGNDFTDKSSLHIQAFDFSESTNGIYINKISEDATWFEQNPRKGGLMVGEVTLDTLMKAPSQINSTFIMIR